VGTWGVRQTKRNILFQYPGCILPRLSTRAYPHDASPLRDADKDSVIGDWQKSATKRRAEEIKESLLRLKEPEVEGETVLLLVQEVTAVTGQNRMQHRSGILFDKGSTCSMISKDLVARLRL
jgi:hypothetical protein